ASAAAQWNDDAERCRQLIRAKGDPDERLRVCTRAIESGDLTKRNLAVTYSNRGTAYYDKGDFERAIADFDKSLELYPGNIDALMNRAMAYGMAGDHDRAIADFDAVIAREPEVAQAYNGRCYSLALAGKAAGAIEDCNRALALAPNTPYIL